MTKAKHTAGPWYVTTDTHGDICVNNHEKFPSEFPIARIAKHMEETQANAHLIAAAPEMLEALEGLLEGIEAQDPSQIRFNLPHAKAAIAKAKGEA